VRDANNLLVSTAANAVTATVASGSGTLAGTSTVTAVNGIATFANLRINGAGAHTLTFTASGLTPVTSTTITVVTGGGFATPNILNNASFETGWDGFTSWTGITDPLYVPRDNTLAYDGSWSVVKTWTPNPVDQGSQFLYHIGGPGMGGVDRVWERFYFRLTAPVSTVMKFARFTQMDNTGNLGGFFIEQGTQIISWGWDLENAAILTSIGLTEAQVIDGNWHSLEVDYWRNGDPSGWPSVAFWFDGAPLSLPDGTPVHYQGSGNKAYWLSGRLQAGERGGSNPIGWQNFLGTLNGGNTTTGQVNIDRIAISSVGRIGR
jgi:hypothetical protein